LIDDILQTISRNHHRWLVDGEHEFWKAYFVEMREKHRCIVCSKKRGTRPENGKARGGWWL